MSAPLAKARKVAEALVCELCHACERIEIAGSVRREKAMVSDLELIAIPRVEERDAVGQTALFGAPKERVSLLWEALERMRAEGRIRPIKPGRGKTPADFEDDERWPEKRLEGSRYFRLWLPKPRLKLDLFVTTPARWPCVLVIRTGPAEFSAALVKHWTRVSGGGHFSEGELTDRYGRRVDVFEEEDVFRALGLSFIPPQSRPQEWVDAVLSQFSMEATCETH